MAEQELTEVYANQVSFEFRTYDVTLEFSVQHGKPSDIEVRKVARVIMSPLHAKVMSELLAKNLKQYEAQVGQLTIPEDIRNKLGI